MCESLDMTRTVCHVYAWQRVWSAPGAGRGISGREDAEVEEHPGLSFGGLLKQLRSGAGLTQEELAGAAGLSSRSISDLERGINRSARKDTAVMLADALGLAGSARQAFVASARGMARAGQVAEPALGVTPGALTATTRALPRDVAGFTGRRADLARLLDSVANAANGGIYAVGGMAGVGKTAFAVHAAHALAPSFPGGQFFLPLHAHTVGHRPVEPADGLASLLAAAGFASHQIPDDLDARAARWRDFAAGRQILLLLDDAAGHSQVRPLLPGSSRSLVLITSRRRLTALPDAEVIGLDALPAADATELLARRAGRPDLSPGNESAGELARLCGHLPLAIGMVAAQLRHHPARTASGLAAEMTAASSRLAAMRAEDLSVAAAFELSYADLSPCQQRFFTRLGLIPGSSIDAYAASAVAGTSAEAARSLLDELYDQHLLIEPRTGRYVLHDLLREFAHALAGALDPAEPEAAIGRLLDYYLHTAVAASRHIPALPPLDLVPQTQPPAFQPDHCTFSEAAEWLEAERANLHAVADYAAASGRTLYAVQIPAALGDFLRAHGDWAQSAELHQTALAAARQAGDTLGEAMALRQLGIVAWLSGDFQAAASRLSAAAALYAQGGHRPNHAYTLDQLGMVQQLTGDYAASMASRKQALARARHSGDRLAEALAVCHLGEIQRITGDYAAALVNLQKGLSMYRQLNFEQGEADVLGELGRLHRDAGDYPAAVASLTRSLALFRAFDHRPFIATVLNELGLLYQLTGDLTAATSSHLQALKLSRDLGIRYAEAETLNSLGELSSRNSATRQARDRHAQALAIARGIGLPLEEARALEGTGRSHLQDGNTAGGLDYLRQALAIYHRIGAPAAHRAQDAIDQLIPAFGDANSHADRTSRAQTVPSPAEPRQQLPCHDTLIALPARRRRYEEPAPETARETNAYRSGNSVRHADLATP